MISAWHLLWIIPLAGSVGFFVAAILSANNLEQIKEPHSSEALLNNSIANYNK